MLEIPSTKIPTIRPVSAEVISEENIQHAVRSANGSIGFADIIFILKMPLYCKNIKNTKSKAFMVLKITACFWLVIGYLPSLTSMPPCPSKEVIIITERIVEKFAKGEISA